jgi:hypothetical protein
METLGHLLLCGLVGRVERVVILINEEQDRVVQGVQDNVVLVALVMVVEGVMEVVGVMVRFTFLHQTLVAITLQVQPLLVG